MSTDRIESILSDFAAQIRAEVQRQAVAALTAGLGPDDVVRVSRKTPRDRKATEPNGSNDAKINDPLIDKALDAVKGTVDPAVITDAYKTFFQQYLSQAVEVPLYYRHDVYIVNPKVGNFVGNGTTATGSWNAQDWFLGQ